MKIYLLVFSAVSNFSSVDSFNSCALTLTSWAVCFALSTTSFDFSKNMIELKKTY